MLPPTTPPVVLTLSGNDPTGGAGLQADCEALNAIGCHSAPIITCVTVQDTANIVQIYPVAPEQIAAQAIAVLNDLPVAAIKIGLLGSTASIEVIAKLLQENSHLPVVLDPILAAGGGKLVADAEIVAAFVELLLPRVTLLTPNSTEVRMLAGQQQFDEAAKVLLATGLTNLLISGGHEPTEPLEHRLYMRNGRRELFHTPRLEGEFHGSGCTLAAIAAGMLAKGAEIEAAVSAALELTHAALAGAWSLGHGQLIPNRKTADGYD